jgi:glycerol-3-phosphate dehydrogenase
MKRMVEALKEEVFDLLIVGGGITGAGVALDGVQRGLSVALIDQGDFASGTSSASSKLVHGGLRYLEHGDFHLVYEALHERGRLLHNAPHLVHPLRFIIPFYRGARVPPWKWRIGLALYDLLAGRSNIQRSRRLPEVELRQTVPQLNPAGLRGGAAYYDAQMDDARICIEVLQTAAALGACLSNYVEAIGFERREGMIRGIRARDRLQGREFSIRARQVLNATGPWVDQVRQLAGETTEPLLQPTKGVHLIVANPGFSSAFLLLHPADGRVLFVIPWLGVAGADAVPPKLLIGTTDTLAAEPPDQLTVTAEEIAYLLEAYNHYLTPSLAKADVLGTFAGLRPLIRARPGEPSDLSREFRLFASPDGLLSAAGGKYTTYRHMAEVITDTIARRLHCQKPCRTHELLLDGAPRGPWPDFLSRESRSLSQRYRLPLESARHLVTRYGRRASAVAAYLDARPALAAPIVAGEVDLQAELVYQHDHEMAMLPADFLLRRTHLGMFRPELLEHPPALLAAKAG